MPRRTSKRGKRADDAGQGDEKKQKSSSPERGGCFKPGQEYEIVDETGKRVKAVWDGTTFKVKPTNESNNDNRTNGAGDSKDTPSTKPKEKSENATRPANQGDFRPPVVSSLSGHWRSQGNTHYKAGTSSEIPRVKRENFDKALTAYHRAFQLSSAVNDTTSAAKNLAMANWKMADVLEKMEEKISIRRFYYGEAVKYFSIGLARGSNVKHQEWIDSLMQSYDACLQEAIQKSYGLNTTEERISDLEKLIMKMEESTFKADVYIELGQLLFRTGVAVLQDGDFKKALSLMRDCYRPAEEAKRTARKREHILQEVRILEGDVYLHQCSAESMQARHQGDEMLDDVLQNEEDLNMDMVYETIDWYKKAIILTKEVEVEMEAIALSRLGSVYDKVLKDKNKAKVNFMRCMQLAHSMHPRTFHSQTWFQVCQEALERYQKEVKEKEDSTWQKERAKFVEELKKELKLLKKKEDLDDKDFLIFVYKEFPPKRKDHRIKDLEKKEWDEMKKTLQKAVTHYHPDRVNVTEFGKKYKVLCEEICKELTKRYERRK